MWIVVILPSARIPFRVEQWDFYDHYASRTWDLGRAEDLLHIAFWTPFGDYRFIPLAWCWNFGMVAVFGNWYEAHWGVSLALNVLNAVLLAHWVDSLLGVRRSAGGVVATAAFLFAAPRQEVVMWTFFTYKLAASALMLVSMLAFEAYLSRGGRWRLGFAAAIVLASAAMYEAAAPLLAVFWVRLALRRSEIPGRFLRETLVIGAWGLVYGVLAAAAGRVVPALIGLSSPFAMAHAPVSLRSLLVSGEWWAFWGVVLPGLGLPVEWHPTDTYLAYTVSLGSSDLLRCVAPVALVIFALAGHRLPWRRAGVVASYGAATAILVYLGRTFTCGESYLSEFGMYQHLPEMFSAAGLGVLVSEGLSRSASGGIAPHRRLVLVLGLLGMLANFVASTAGAVAGYTAMQKPLIDALAEGARRVASSPGIPVDISDISLPFTPSAFSAPQHTYHALHLLYGDAVLDPSQEEERLVPKNP